MHKWTKMCSVVGWKAEEIFGQRRRCNPKMWGTGRGEMFQGPQRGRGFGGFSPSPPLHPHFFGNFKELLRKRCFQPPPPPPPPLWVTIQPPHFQSSSAGPLFGHVVWGECSNSTYRNVSRGLGFLTGDRLRTNERQVSQEPLNGRIEYWYVNQVHGCWITRTKLRNTDWQTTAIGKLQWRTFWRTKSGVQIPEGVLWGKKDRDDRRKS